MNFSFGANITYWTEQLLTSSDKVFDHQMIVKGFRFDYIAILINVSKYMYDNCLTYHLHNTIKGQGLHNFVTIKINVV